MIQIIDNKLINHGSAQQAIKNKDARSLMMFAAEALVGTTESGGNNKGSVVEEIQKTVDGVAGAEPWCMAFVQTCIGYAELKTGIKSPIYESEHCMTVYRNTPKEFRVKKYPARGAVGIMKQKSSDSGHTYFVTSFDPNPKDKDLKTIEGNTGSGSIFDGDGIYTRTRDKEKNGSLITQGHLIPFPEYKPAQVVNNTTEPKEYALAWDSKISGKDSQFLKDSVQDRIDTFSSASDAELIHPQFKSFSKYDKVRLLSHFFVAVAKFESGYNPKSYSVDVGTKNDKGSWSVGLYQLSANDSSAKMLGATFETLQLPQVNISVALIQMDKQIKNTGLIFLPNNSKYRYWAVLLKGNKYSKIDQIIKETRNNFEVL